MAASNWVWKHWCRPYRMKQVASRYSGLFVATKRTYRWRTMVSIDMAFPRRDLAPRSDCQLRDNRSADEQARVVFSSGESEKQLGCRVVANFGEVRQTAMAGEVGITSRAAKGSRFKTLRGMTERSAVGLAVGGECCHPGDDHVEGIVFPVHSHLSLRRRILFPPVGEGRLFQRAGHVLVAVQVVNHVVLLPL